MVFSQPRPAAAVRIFWLIAGVVLTASGPLAADVKVHRVTLESGGGPGGGVPDEVRNIGLIPFDATDAVKKEFPAALPLFQAVLQETLLEKAPGYRYVDRTDLLRLLKEKPNVPIEAVDAVLTGRIVKLKSVSGEGGRGMRVVFAATFRLYMMKTAEILFALDHTEEVPFAVPEGSEAGPERSKAVKEAFRDLANLKREMKAGFYDGSLPGRPDEGPFPWERIWRTALKSTTAKVEVFG